MCTSAAQVIATARGGVDETHAVAKLLAKQLARSDWFEPAPRLEIDITMEDAISLTEDEAFKRVCLMRWPATSGHPICPRCGSPKHYNLQKTRKFKCAGCYYQYSPTSGTSFAWPKGGWAAFLRRVAHNGTINGQNVMSAKTALDVRRRKIANGG